MSCAHTGIASKAATVAHEKPEYLTMTRPLRLAFIVLASKLTQLCKALHNAAASA
jgi:hypothetical protein